MPLMPVHEERELCDNLTVQPCLRRGFQIRNIRVIFLATADVLGAAALAVLGLVVGEVVAEFVVGQNVVRRAAVAVDANGGGADWNFRTAVTAAAVANLLLTLVVGSQDASERNT